MNIKIQGGGGGRYANKSSCTGVVTYLQHEDMDRVMEGLPTESFFDSDYDKVSSKEVTFQIDNNKSNLGKNDSKFYVITISPSKEEIKAMGNNFYDRSMGMKKYTRNLMSEYAKNFNREGLNKGNQIKYYAKIHHERGDNKDFNIHCHVIVSRKCMNNKLKLSPQTNHKETTKGKVRGGFNRVIFYDKAEKLFDKEFELNRNPEQTFKYQNTLKNGNVEDIKMQIKQSINRDRQLDKKVKNKSKDIEI